MRDGAPTIEQQENTMRLASLSLMVLLLAAPAMAQKGSTIAVPGYGAIHDLPAAAERPDGQLRYRVVFSITKAADKPDGINPSLDKVARFLNLLAHDGVRPRTGDIVAVVHGPATSSVVRVPKPLADGSTVKNPNVELIDRLRAAGVTVAVCSQALQGMGYHMEDVLPGVRIDDAALVTMTNLQLRGAAVITD
jgi:intracellular sulfur oxidation DsrE/DsrF family protein